MATGALAPGLVLVPGPAGRLRRGGSAAAPGFWLPCTATFWRAPSCKNYVGNAADAVVSVAGQPDLIGTAQDASFEAFVAGSSARLFTMALLVSGYQRAEAEDLLQGALERAYRSWTRICRSADPERYVRQMLVNASIDRWRRLRRRPEEPLRYPERDLAVGDQAAEVADRDLLLRALAALPVRQRAVLVLRYFEDLTEAQTAAILGCSAGTVKSQASRALARLRQVCDLPGEPEPPAQKGAIKHD